MRRVIKSLVSATGYEVRRKALAGTGQRPITDMKALLEDLRQRGLRPRSVLDVGANLGNWSRMAKTIFPEADCFLIEPQIECQRALESFCAAYPGSRHLLVGAGAGNASLALTIWDDLVGSSFLPPEAPHLKEAGKQRIVPVVTIDSLIGEGVMPDPQLVKLDVQGYELEVLRGAERLFESVEAFILETSLFVFMDGMPLFHEVIAFMADRHYLVYDFPGFLRRPHDGALGQVDVCFVKRGGMLRLSDSWE